MSGPLTPGGSGPDESMGLARARGLEFEAEQAARHRIGQPPEDRSGDRRWGRILLIALSIFVLAGWALTIINAIASHL